MCVPAPAEAGFYFFVRLIMKLETLFPHIPAMGSDTKRGQGRSKKPLRIKVEHDGRVFVARYEGRPGRCFGLSEKEATYGLRAGQ